MTCVKKKVVTECGIVCSQSASWECVEVLTEVVSSGATGRLGRDPRLEHRHQLGYLQPRDTQT